MLGYAQRSLGTLCPQPVCPAVLKKELNQRIENAAKQAGQKDYFDGADFPEVGCYECKCE